MKKIFACVITGLFLVGVAGLAQADEIDGPTVNKRHVRPTIVVLDQGPLYIEGMGFTPRPEGVKTVVPKVAASRDWCCEDMSKAEEEMHFKKANEIEPAAGS